MGEINFIITIVVVVVMAIGVVFAFAMLNTSLEKHSKSKPPSKPKRKLYIPDDKVREVYALYDIALSKAPANHEAAYVLWTTIGELIPETKKEGSKWSLVVSYPTVVFVEEEVYEAK